MVLIFQTAAAQECPKRLNDLQLKTTKASASWFTNLRGSESSIKFQTNHMLDDAQEQAELLRSKPHPCLAACKETELNIIFNSAPNKFQVDYDEFDHCQQFLESTTRQPIEFSNRLFDTVADFEDWYHDLAQGSGDDGEELYKLCPGSCSPIYTSIIKSDPTGLKVTTRIICGHARDQDDNQYILQSALHWRCKELEDIS